MMLPYFYDLPVRFRLFGQTIEVTRNSEDFVEKEGLSGFACFRRNQIQIKDNPHRDKLGQTFFHELMHFVLYHAGAAYHPDKQDYMHQAEDFVDLCGSLLHQAFTSMEFEDWEFEETTPNGG